MLGSLAGGQVLAEKYGQGEPQVICLHGWGRTASDFQEICQGLDAAAVQLPGFGIVDPPNRAWRPVDYAHWLAPALDPEHPAIVVGHSFGGRIAIRLAAHYPERVRALVLTGVPMTKLHPAKGPDWRYALIRSLNSIGLVSEARLESARRRFGSADYRAAEGVMREILVQTVAEDYLDDVKALAMPVELVWGAHDRPAPLEVAKKAKELLPVARLTVVDDAEHLLGSGLIAAVREAIRRQLADDQMEGER